MVTCIYFSFVVDIFVFYLKIFPYSNSKRQSPILSTNSFKVVGFFFFFFFYISILKPSGVNGFYMVWGRDPVLPLSIRLFSTSIYYIFLYFPADLALYFYHIPKFCIYLSLFLNSIVLVNLCTLVPVPHTVLVILVS